MGEEFIAHAGRSKRDGAKIGSGRYPLGSGERPFQAEEGKKNRRGLFRKKSKKTSAEEPPKKLSDDEKKQIIDKGDIRAAYKYRDQLTNTDIDAVVNRYNKEKTLKDLMPKQKKGIDYLDKSSSILKSTAQFINSGINVWNASARAINTFTKYDLPTVKDAKDYPNKFKKYLTK